MFEVIWAGAPQKQQMTSAPSKDSYHGDVNNVPTILSDNSSGRLTNFVR